MFALPPKFYHFWQSWSTFFLCRLIHSFGLALFFIVFYNVNQVGKSGKKVNNDFQE